MNEATLTAFREIADTMGCGKENTWAIVIDYTAPDGTKRASVKAFGYTRERAEKCATYYKGGRAVPETAVLNKIAAHCYCSQLSDGRCDFCTGTRRPQ